MTKFLADSINDIAEDFIEKSVLYNTYSIYKKPFENYKDKKFEKSQTSKTFINIFQDNLDSSIEAILDEEKIVILLNDHFNDQVIEETLKSLPTISPITVSNCSISTITITIFTVSPNYHFESLPFRIFTVSTFPVSPKNFTYTFFCIKHFKNFYINIF